MIPRVYQLEAVKFHLANFKSFNLSEPRTGKTASVLWSLQQVLVKNPNFKVLVIAPKSTLSFTWVEEFKNLGFDLSIINIHKFDTQVTITNYHRLERIKDHKFDVVIVDEFTFLKNPTSQRSKAFRSIVNTATIVWGLSGTPVAQSAMDSYVMLATINPAAITDKKGKLYSYDTVKQRLYDQPYPNVWTPRADLVSVVSKLLTPAFRVSMKDTGLLTDNLAKEKIKVALNYKQVEVLKQLEYDCSVDDQAFTNKAVWTSKAVQICSGFNYLQDPNPLDITKPTRRVLRYGSSKYTVLQALLETHAQGKVIVFSSFTETLQQLKKSYPYAGLVYGATSDKDRKFIFSSFQRGNLGLLVMNPRSCSHGLTLSAGDVIVWFEPTSSEVYAQANYRITRVQGERPAQQYAYMLYSSKYDLKGYDVAEAKGRVQDEIFKLLKSKNTK
jgi:SNF2 family DNA or RNA helicase